MGRRIIIVIAFLFFTGAFLALPVFSHPLDQSVEDFQTIRELLKAGKQKEALALLDRVITEAEQAAGAAQADPQSKPGLLKSNLSEEQLTRMGAFYWLRSGMHTDLLDWDLALADSNLALAVAPEAFAEYFVQRAICHLHMEEYELVIADYSAALEAKFIKPSPQEQAAIYISRASAFWSQLKYDQALADFDRAIRLTPQDRTLYEERIKLWENKGDYQKAVEEVSRLIRLDPGDIALYEGRATRYESLKEHEKALKDYATVLTLAKDKKTQLRARERRATIFEVQTSEGQNRNAEAVTEYTAILELEPGNTQWLSMRARAKLRNEDTQGAFSDYEECLKRAPGKGWPYRLRAEAYYDLGNYDQAIRDLDRALKLDPADATANYLRGLAKVGQKDFRGAIADYDIALKKYPKADTYYVARGKAYWALDEGEKAVQDITSAVDLKPKLPDYRTLRGNYYLGLCQFDKAQADYSQALELDPNFIDAIAGKADVAFFIGNYRKAQADYTAFLKVQPQAPIVYYRRGVCSFSLGDYRSAVRDYKKAIELDPKYLDALKSLAWLLATSPQAAVRNGSQAVEYGKKALELAGQNDPIIMDTLAAALAEAGRYEDAASLEKMAISLLPQDFDLKERANWQARLALYQKGQPYREKK